MPRLRFQEMERVLPSGSKRFTVRIESDRFSTWHAVCIVKGVPEETEAIVFVAFYDLRYGIDDPISLSMGIRSVFEARAQGVVSLSVDVPPKCLLILRRGHTGDFEYLALYGGKDHTNTELPDWLSSDLVLREVEKDEPHSLTPAQKAVLNYMEVVRNCNLRSEQRQDLQYTAQQLLDYMGINAHYDPASGYLYRRCFLDKP